MKIRRVAIAILTFTIALFFFGVLCMKKYENYNHSHKLPDGSFHNNFPGFESHGLSSMLKWIWFRVGRSMPQKDPENYKFETLVNDGKDLRENTSKLSVTWVGHATVLVQMNGKNILTDPIWSKRCSPVSFAGPSRYTKPGISLDHLPKIDMAIVSHNHYDHMDLYTLKELQNRFATKIFTGLGNKKFLETNGLNDVTEMDWWDQSKLDSLTVTFTPTQHFSMRSLMDRNETLWGSFIVTDNQKTIYFAGDTGYFPGFKMISERFPSIDLAILPIGAYDPRWFMKSVHMDPPDSVKAFIDLKAKNFVPMHYQTFVLSDEPLDAPLKITIEEFKKHEIDINRLIQLKIGESRFF